MIVLDTHTWLWWNGEPEKLSKTAFQAIEGADLIGVCPISCWEISTKVARGRLSLDRDVRDWVQRALARPHVELLEISAGIAIEAGRMGLQGFHGDPADRLITATAMYHDTELVTKDRQIRAFPLVKTIW